MVRDPDQNLLDRLIRQLDELVAFLNLAHEEVFSVVRQNYRDWVESNQQGTLPDSFRVFEAQITSSTLLLGHSYFEAFLADVIRQIYTARPEMLSDKKHLSYNYIKQASDYDEIIQVMINREVKDVRYKNMGDIAKYFKDPLNIKWPDYPRVAEATELRNCIVHNSSVVNDKLAQISSRSTGDQIRLSVDYIHQLGLDARSFAEELYAQVESQLPCPADS